jgi:hypothetical protein
LAGWAMLRLRRLGLRGVAVVFQQSKIEDDDDDENDWKSGIFGLGQLCRTGSVRTESS